MVRQLIVCASFGYASAFSTAAVGASVASRATHVTMVDSWYDSGERLIPEEALEAATEEPVYFCNDQGCWVGAPEDDFIVRLPDGRIFSGDFGVQPYTDKNGAELKVPRRPAAQGLFAPLVKGTKRVMGEKDLNKLRGTVIKEHSAVIAAFVDTSESPFGQIVLKQMFDAADKDGNGTLDREEVRDALRALGFNFIEDKQLDKIFERGDLNGDEVIDFEEFVKETPKTLRSSLVKLAKQNGHDLGFLA